MPELPSRVWSEDDWNRIRLGYKARDMDEKWNVFVESRTVFLHRSWTGRGIYEASFVEADGGWRIGAAVVESEPGQFRRISADYDRLMLELVLSGIVLGESVDELRAELAAAVPRGPDVPAGVVLHSHLGVRTQS